MASSWRPKANLNPSNHALHTVCNQQNPLLIKVVIVEVFKRLPVPTLLSCRLVNSLWKEESTYQLQRRKSNCLNLLTKDKIVQFTKFIASCKNLSSFPVVKFKLNTSHQKVNLSSHALLKCLEIISPWVAELHITFNEFTDFSPVRLAKRYTFPKLVYLGCEIDCRDPTNFNKATSEEVYNIIRQIVQQSSVLASAWFASSQSLEDTTKLISCLESTHRNNTPSKLTIHSQLLNNQLEEIMRIGLKLKEFTILLITPPQVSANLLSNFLEIQTDTLENLEIQTLSIPLPIYAVPKASLEFPRMKKLTRISLQHNNSLGIRDLIIGSVNFNNLPSLTSLMLSEAKAGTETWEEIFQNNENTTCNTLTKLELKFSQVSTEMIKRVSGLFPNLVKLRIPAKQDIVQLMFSLMPKLEELTLDNVSHYRNSQDNGLMDYMILGRTQAQCKEIRNTCRRDWLQMEESLAKSKPTQMTIACLKNLKTLKLACRGKIFTGLSDLACIELMELKSLRRLEFLESYPSSQWISKAMIRQMRYHFMVVKGLNSSSCKIISDASN